MTVDRGLGVDGASRDRQREAAWYRACFLVSGMLRQSVAAGTITLADAALCHTSAIQVPYTGEWQVQQVSDAICSAQDLLAQYILVCSQH